jgi:hypothetical protein
MPNQNGLNQNPDPIVPANSDVSTNQKPNDNSGINPVSTTPPVIFPQSDLPPLPPEFQNPPDGNIIETPKDLPSNQLNTDRDGSENPPDMSSITTKPKKKFGGGKIIATILGLVVLVGGVGAGILLTQQQQLFNQEACGTTVTCGPVKAYDANWVALTNAQLSTLKPEANINFCVSGTAATGTFDKAQFKINSTVEPETITKRSGSSDFCQAYTVLSTDTAVNVRAKIHNSISGWIGESF